MNILHPIANTSRIESLGHSANYEQDLDKLMLKINAAWDKIVPTWPLQNVIARNPLAGLESLNFKDALKVAAGYFESDIPLEFGIVNAQTIKWCQAYFDNKQATIFMPGRELGLYNSWKSLAIYDNFLLSTNQQSLQWLVTLSDSPILAIRECLTYLAINHEHEEKFLTSMLVTLPGWAGYVKYLINYTCITKNSCQIDYLNYLAFRLAITCLLWPQAATFVIGAVANDMRVYNKLKKIEKKEQEYREPLLKSLKNQAHKISSNQEELIPAAQLVFCIDVRSEPLRRAIESQGDYKTYGFAGFFGIPVSIKEYASKNIKDYCPVLIKSKHLITEVPLISNANSRVNVADDKINLISALYQSLKYNFTTVFALVETLGPWLGLSMLLKTFAPNFYLGLKNYFKNLFGANVATEPSSEDIMLISLVERCNYAKNALSMIGLTNNFAPLVVFCGHGSSTQNNADASGLDCGACAGNHGGTNAQILAKILNNQEVRKELVASGIDIPSTTVFLAGKHDTTTDEVTIYQTPNIPIELNPKLQQLKLDLEHSKNLNNAVRCAQLGINQMTHVRSADWSQTRPEWGLAKNACFIIGSRELTEKIDLHGRAFLHSYNWKIDYDGALLETILTAPMIVAEWINTQYLFSTLNNVAYGSGSKITQNISCKLGIMQGNASDLMYGLSLQSVNSSSLINYHETLRLLTVIHAPLLMVTEIIKKQPILQQLFMNDWVSLAVIDPESHQLSVLGTNLGWNSVD